MYLLVTIAHRSNNYIENCNHKTNKSIRFDTECPVYINNAKGSLFLPWLTLNRCALYQMSRLRLCGKHSKNNYYSEATYWTLSRDVEWSLIHCVLKYLSTFWGMYHHIKFFFLFCCFFFRAVSEFSFSNSRSEKLFCSQKIYKSCYLLKSLIDHSPSL